MAIGERDPLTEKVIGLAIEVHRFLGPGLLESAYEECLCYEIKELSRIRTGLLLNFNAMLLKDGIKRMVI